MYKHLSSAIILKKKCDQLPRHQRRQLLCQEQVVRLHTPSVQLLKKSGQRSATSADSSFAALTSRQFGTPSVAEEGGACSLP
jgi:hypothetical protein